jgi:uncharacterized protein YcbK (DUF882 family)
LLDAFCEETGKAVKLTSVYRSPEYNASVTGSAKRSLHMEFLAADLIPSSGTSGEWADKLKSMRARGAFQGGIGIYNSFVHVDVRGREATWDQRT